MDYFELLKRRRSVRRFTAEGLSPDEISRLLLAAGGAPVGSNLYRDIHLTVIQDRGILDRLSEATQKRFADKAELQKIIGDIKPEALSPAVIRDPFYGAPVVILASHLEQSIQPGIEYSNVACVVLSMHLAATEMGLASVLLWTVDAHALKRWHPRCARHDGAKAPVPLPACSNPCAISPNWTTRIC
ncbi:MAG: nitroreductase family protein [Clostridiales Family XIII bacterium]|jgi:nitroreductase|nr:nitroreductase family protein [Clostridiales Family XIII bacterium]